MRRKPKDRFPPEDLRLTPHLLGSAKWLEIGRTKLNLLIQALDKNLSLIVFKRQLPFLIAPKMYSSQAFSLVRSLL